MSAKGNAVTPQASGTVAKKTPFEVMLRAMANDAQAEIATFSGDDLNAILSAENEEELWESDNRPPLNFQHLAGQEIAVIDFAVKFSRGSNDTIKTPFLYVDDGGNQKKMYLLCKCVRLSESPRKNKLINLPPVGEEFEANTSARFIVAKLWRAMTLGMMSNGPLNCEVEETDLGGGEGVLKLRPLRKPGLRVTSTVETEEPPF